MKIVEDNHSIPYKVLKMDDELKQPLFPNLSAEDADQMPMSVESLCMSCEEMGVTKILLTKIPYFKEVIITSFECPHCGLKNNEIQTASVCQDKGLKVELKVLPKDLNRQVVKAASASVKIPELDFEIPAFSQKGELSTIEGILDRAITALKQDQPVRLALDPTTAERIERLLGDLDKYKRGESPFTFVLDDISGNSFLENPFAPKKDESMTITTYERAEDDDHALGIFESAEKREEESAKNDETKEATPENVDFTQEVLEFPTNCSNCQNPASTNMKAVDIPFFKQVILMATSCTFCGKRSSEVKSGAGIEDKGTKITLKITDITDLNRDVLKSDTCVLKIPEMEFELQSGTLGGRFTTIEGLFVNIKESLENQFPFGFGDALSLQEDAKNMKKFLGNLAKVIAGEWLDIHVILDDSAGNSYIQNVYAPDEDPNMKIESYERTKEQNEELGLSEQIIAEHMARKSNTGAEKTT